MHLNTILLKSLPTRKMTPPPPREVLSLFWIWAPLDEAMLVCSLPMTSRKRLVHDLFAHLLACCHWHRAWLLGTKRKHPCLCFCDFLLIFFLSFFKKQHKKSSQKLPCVYFLFHFYQMGLWCFFTSTAESTGAVQDPEDICQISLQNKSPMYTTQGRVKPRLTVCPASVLTDIPLATPRWHAYRLDQKTFCPSRLENFSNKTCTGDPDRHNNTQHGFNFWCRIKNASLATKKHCC